MNDKFKEHIIGLLHQLLAAGLVSKEDLCKEFNVDYIDCRDDEETLKNKKRIVNYLQGKTSVSNATFSIWCNSNGIKNVKIKGTLEHLLGIGFFGFRSKRGSRTYYTKGINNSSILLSEKDIFID